MKKSPLNFGALAGAASSISARLAGGVGGPTNLAAILGGGIFGKRRGKGMRGRVQKLENQMGVLMRDRNKNAADEAMDVGPGELTVGGEPVSAAQNPSVSATQDSLTPMNSFTPGSSISTSAPASITVCSRHRVPVTRTTTCRCSTPNYARRISVCSLVQSMSMESPVL